MAILTSYKVPGDPHELLAKDRETSGQRAREIAVKNGQLTQVIVDEGDGLRRFHLWEGEDGMLRAAGQIHSVAPAACALQQERRQWDVLHHEIWARPTGV